MGVSVGAGEKFGKWRSSCFSEVNRDLAIDVLESHWYLCSLVDIGSDFYLKYCHSDGPILHVKGDDYMSSSCHD